MASPSEEIELKFRLSEAALCDLRRELFADAPVRRLTSIYYETPDRGLAAHGLALRLRHDGEHWVQTIKGRGAIARYEDETVAAEASLDPARLRAAPGQVDERLIAALAPALELRVDRRAREHWQASSRIELALDEGVILDGEAEHDLRELELELKDGALTDLFGAARRLCLRPGVLLSLTSKAEQGYRVLDGAAERPIRFRTPPLTPEMPVRDAFQALAMACLAQLCSAAELIAARPTAPAVHQARVALRRLRVLIGGFHDAVADGRVEVMKLELKRMTALLADARSLDVFAADTFDAGDAAPGARAFGEAIGQARDAAYGRAQAGVQAWFAAGLIDLAEWILDGPWTRDPALARAGDRPLASLASRLLRRRRRAMRKRGRRLDWRDARARHKLRIQAKKMHYLIDALAPSKAGGKFHRRLKRLQAQLGDLNDIVAAAAAARLALGPSAHPSTALAAGMMVGARKAGTRRLIRRAQRAFRDWAKHPPIRADIR